MYNKVIIRERFWKTKIWAQSASVEKNGVLKLKVSPEEDVIDLSGRDYDALNSDKWVCAESYIIHTYCVELCFIKNYKESLF